MLNHQNGHFFDHDGARIYYERAGLAGGHPLLLLHGGLGTLEDFAGIADALTASFDIVAIDLRGHGRSTLGSRPLTYEQHQRDVLALAAHLGLAEYSLLGLSDGGIAAYRIAAGNPAVRALVTIGAQWRLSRESPAFEILSSVTPAMWAEMFPAAPAQYAALNPQGDFGQLVAACVGLWTDLSPTGYPQDSIAQIACPALILRGDTDFLLSLSEAADIQARVDGASLGNIPLAGHDALHDAPDITAWLVRDFLVNPRKAQREP